MAQIFTEVSSYLQKYRHISLILLLMLTGCARVQEISLLKGSVRPKVTLYNRSLLTNFDLRREKIDTASSYIESPAGVLYKIQTQAHKFDIKQKRDYVSTLVVPVATNGSQLHNWQDGIWTFHFVVESNSTPKIIEQQWKFYHWYYSPLIHGYPN